MRNVRFSREGTYLKNLPVYMRYGSFQELYKAYSQSVASHLRVGRTGFQTILKVITVKGSYNRGISYYYVDFVNMINLLMEMFDRMQSITNEFVSKKQSRDEIKIWIDRARKNTKRSRDYLTHHYYGEIEQSTQDSWTCAAFALGHSSADAVNTLVLNESRIFLAFTNHLYIYHLGKMILDALPKNHDESLNDELKSMFDLATFSAKDMLYYSKHLMRG
jgi:hypothetical protein